MARRTAGTLLLLGLSTTALAQDSDQGTLNVSSPVAGAQVYVDNDLQGPAPLTVALPAGEHSVRILADGFSPFVRRIEVAAGQPTDLTARLSPGTGSIEFASASRDAIVRIDGQEWELPIRLSSEDVGFGDHDYTISAPTYAEQDGSLSFSSGENVFIYARLESNAGRLAFSSTPAAADVFINGERIGATPLELSDYAPDVYSIRMERDRHATVFRELDTTDGDIGVVEARLPERGAKLVVKTGNDDAEVFIEGQLMGTGSKVVIPELERRQYAVEVHAPGLKPASNRLDVPIRGTLTYAVDFQAEENRAASALVNVPPLTQRWTFWTATGVGAAAVAVGGVLIYNALQPEPVPAGDVVVTLP